MCTYNPWVYGAPSGIIKSETPTVNWDSTPLRVFMLSPPHNPEIIQLPVEETKTCYQHSAGLWAGCLDVWLLAGAGNFSLHSCIKTGSGAHPASYPVGTSGTFPGVR
jgi:hypothetical protein